MVFPALLVNYYGQGALLLADPAAVSNPFFRMAPEWALYPLVAIATVATVIASQATISGAFSMAQQATLLGVSPRARILHTSPSEYGQIYVPAVNWLQLTGVLGIVLAFKTGPEIASAYGIAVTGTMIITTVLVLTLAVRGWKWPLAAAIPLAAVGLLVWLGVKEETQQYAVAVLVLTGVAGTVMVYVLEGRIRADLEALADMPGA